MDLAAIQETFHQWVQALDEQGLPARHVRSFADGQDGLVVVTVLSTARLDPVHRAHVSRRARSAELPLARLQYVVAVNDVLDPAQAEHALLSLLLEAGRHPAMRLLPDPVSASWWLAHGVAPLPSFQIEASVTEPVPGPTTPAIKDHSVGMNTLNAIHGQVVSAAGLPIPGAEVRLGLGQVVQSDSHGRFKLSDIGDDLNQQAVRVQVRDQQQTFKVPQIPKQEGRWLLRMDESEDR